MKNKINLIIEFAIALVFSFIAIASAQTTSCPMGGVGGMMYEYYGSGAVIFSWIIYLLVVVLIVVAIYWLIKSSQKSGRKN